MPDPDAAADVSTSTADLAAVISLTPPQVPLPPSVIATAKPSVAIPSTPALVPLPPSTRPSDRSVATSDHSYHASCRQQARNNLTHIILVLSLTDSPSLVYSVVSCYTTISILHVSTRAELKALRLQDDSMPTPDDVNNLLSIARYANLSICSHVNSISKSMWQ